jgi:hypothetical protein
MTRTLQFSSHRPLHLFEIICVSERDEENGTPIASTAGVARDLSRCGEITADPTPMMGME